MNNPLLNTLFTYDGWATRHLLKVCCTLTQAQLEQPMGLDHSNLERTLAHLVGAMLFFADRLNRTVPRPRLDRDHRTRTAAELLELFERANRELHEAIAKTIDAHALTDILNWTDEDMGDIDPLDQITYAVAFAQMIDHNIHHRTQAMDMLRLLGIDTPMDWHPFDWEETTRSQFPTNL